MARASRGIWMAVGFAVIGGAVAVVALVAALPASVVSDASVPPEALPSLVIGQEDLPWDAVLGHVRIGAKVPIYALEYFDGPSKLSESWSGPPVYSPGCLTSPRYSISIAIAVTSSPEEAAGVAHKEVGSVAEEIPEVTGQESVAWFSDRAWRGGNAWGGRIVFTRGNVVGDVHMSHKEGLDSDLLIGLAAILGRKIDAALAGRPEPPPALPPSAEEWGGTVEKAWKVREVRENLWGEDTTTIALQGSFPIPRAVSAKYLGFRDYLVPIGSFRLIFDKREFHLDTREGKVWVTTPDVQVALEEGKSFVKVGKVPVALSHPIESQNNVTTVPLSFAETVLGYDITWEDRADMPLARITAPERGE